MKLREALFNKMKSDGLNPTDLSRETKLNVVTIKRALTGDAKLSVYHTIAKALGVTIKYTVD